MISTVAHSYADIQRFLDELGAPTEGLHRVYRGQGRSYQKADGAESIIPALQRGDRLGYDPGWLVKTSRLLRLATTDNDEGLPIELATLWAPALLQQYGPGSYYVDVSFDATISLWFALHRYNERWMSIRSGDEKIGRFDRWMLTTWYDDSEPVTADASLPVLYVFDQPMWNGNVAPKFGALVDLLSSPTGEWFRKHATRVVRQSGALLHANPLLVEQGDVGSLLRAAIRLAPDFDRESIPGINRPTKEVFPLPSDDAMYGLLLKQPEHLHYSPTHLEHPLNLSWYFSATPSLWSVDEVKRLGGVGTRTDPVQLELARDADPGQNDWSGELAGYLRTCDNVAPVLLLSEISDTTAAQMDVGDTHVSLDAALPILMESVLYISTPPANGDRSPWIESSLPLGISEEIDGHSTRSVFIELAPIDFIDITEEYWTGIPRAFWMVRTEQKYFIRTYRQHESTLHVCTWEFVYDPQTGAFSLETFTPSGPRENVALSDEAAARKALYLTLTALRDLSPGWKPPVQHGTIEWHERDGKRVPRRIPAAYLIPQRANLVPIDGRRCFTLRTLRDSTYHLGVRPDPLKAPVDAGEERTTLQRYLPALRDRFYIVYAAPRLIELHREAGDWIAVVQVVHQAVSLLHDDPQFRAEMVGLLFRELFALGELGIAEGEQAQRTVTFISAILDEMSAGGIDVSAYRELLEKISQ